MFKNILFIISNAAPENVYLDKNMSILGGLEADIFCKMATTGVSKMFVFLLD